MLQAASHEPLLGGGLVGGGLVGGGVVPVPPPPPLVLPEVKAWNAWVKAPLFWLRPLQVDDALVSDPSGVVRQFLPVVDRPHLERLVEGLESIQRIHRDIEEYGKLRDMLLGVMQHPKASRR